MKKVIKIEYKYDVTKMFELAEDGENWRFYNDEQRFAISNLGRVYDLKLDKLVKLYLSGSGYYVCYLCDYVEGVKQLPVPVHRLVAETLEYKKKYSDVSDLLIKKELEIAELQREKQALSEQVSIYRNTIAEMRLLFESINYC